MTTNEKIIQRKIEKNQTLIQALKKMDEMGIKSLLVLEDNNKFIGIISIGDIQRAIIKNISLNNKVANVLRANPRIGYAGMKLEQIKEEMIKYRMEFMPIIDKENKIQKVYFWDELFVEKKLPPKKKFNLPVIIMAGGLGTRLKPLTNVLPKPLIPIGQKSNIEEIFDRFGNHGCNHFYISVNFKAELVEFYLSMQNLPYSLEYFKEDKPLGTAGSLSLLKEKIDKTFFVTNCDILIEQDYSEILEFHRNNNNEITMVAVIKHYPITYGLIESGNNGELVSLIEKPELTFKINSGMYILEPHLLKEIPEKKIFHITNLITNLKHRHGKIGVFPVSEGSWKDIGGWEDYLKWVK